MKKKLFNLFFIVCLIFPTFFIIACNPKTNNNTPNSNVDPAPTPTPSVEPYTVSITLKNIKNKINESTLAPEFDFVQNKSVNWTKSGNDISISVSKTAPTSSSLSVSLLEGYNYSNLSFLVNGTETAFSVTDGFDTNCAAKAYATNRYFQYNYQINSSTTMVVDFANCSLAQVTLDLSNLKTNNVKYKQIDNTFANLSNAKSYTYDSISGNSVTVDYGTVLAFDSKRSLLFYGTDDIAESLNVASYGAKYLTSLTNQIQYITAKKDGACKVSSAISDVDGKYLKMVGCDGIGIAESLQALNDSSYLTRVNEQEYYDGKLISTSVCKIESDTIYLNLDENYNYYVLNSIDGLCSTPLSKVGGKYQYSFQESGVKYLLRLPKNESDYYLVAMAQVQDDVLPINYDYIKIISDDEYGYKVYFCYNTTKNIEFSVKRETIDLASGNLMTNSAITFYYDTQDEYGDNIDSGSESFSNLAGNPSWTIYDESACTYIISDYNFTQNSNTTSIQLNKSSLFLYENEEVYYTKNDPTTGWQKWTTSTVSLTSAVDGIVYYYIKTDRDDAYLRFLNSAGTEEISKTGLLLDCFGRALTGTASVGDEKIDLSKVYYLTVDAGISAYNTSILRSYDMTNHTIDISNLTNENIKVSVGMNALDGSSYSSLNTQQIYTISYAGVAATVIYFYINDNSDQILVLKNGNNVVSKVEALRNNLTLVTYNGKIIYALTLIPGYYEKDAVFTLTAESAKYVLQNEHGASVSVYDTAGMENVRTQLTKNTTFYFVGDSTKTYKIFDKLNNVVVENIAIEQSNIETNKNLYVFNLAWTGNYENGYSFVLKAID